MQVTERNHGEVIILSISVNMLGEPGSRSLCDKVDNLIKEVKNKIIIDLENVKSINSTGVGIIMYSWSTLGRNGGILKLANVGYKINNLFEITELDQIFEIHDSIDEAIRSFLS